MSLVVLFNLGNQPSGPGQVGAPPWVGLQGATMNVSPMQTVVRKRIPEHSSAVIMALFQDEDGEPIPADSLTEVTLTLYDVRSGAIINARNKQSIFNLNGGTVAPAGTPPVMALTFNMSPADNALIGSEMFERHVALFEWKWDSAAKEDRHEVILTVRDFIKVP